MGRPFHKKEREIEGKTNVDFFNHSKLEALKGQTNPDRPNSLTSATAPLFYPQSLHFYRTTATESAA